MVKGFCTSGLFDEHNSIVSAVSGGVTIVVGIVRAISADGGVIIIIVGLARVSLDGVCLVWGWVVFVFSFVSFSGIIEVLIRVEGVASFPVRCCSS